MITWTEMWTKTQRLTKDSNADVLTQLKQDLNTGYHMFNQKLGRYYSRKQQFTDAIVNQSQYQTPIDSIRVIGMTWLVTPTYEIPLKEIRSEYEWRQIVSVKNYKSNWPTWYFVLGKDQIAVWPTPSQDVTNGIRFYYQPQDHDLSVEDITSVTTGSTVTVTNGDDTVTADSDTPFTEDMATLSFQVTGQTDLTWYDIESATTTELTLKSAYAAMSGSGKAWRIGQTSIIPQEYQDAPMHYALGNYWSAQGNESRSAFHLGTKDKPGMFYTMMTACQEDYSSSLESSVIDEPAYDTLNLWLVPPPNSNP